MSIIPVCMKKQFSFVFVFALLCVVVTVLPVHAVGNLQSAGANLGNAADKAGVTGQADLPTVIGTVINAALTLVGLFFLILMVYAGYLWMTARGESDQVDKAKKIITGTVIGLVIVLSAYAITTFVTTSFTK
jgi:hypothetical protein